jgi:hypothetical protein
VTTTSSSGAEWSKMSHAGAVRRERESNESLNAALKTNDELVLELKQLAIQHAQDIENIKQEFRTQHANKTIEQIQTELDNAIAIKIDMIDRNNAKNKSNKRKAHSTTCLPMVAESMPPPPPKSPTQPQVSLNISQPKGTGSDELMNSIYQKGVTRNWGDDSDDDDDEFAL